MRIDDADYRRQYDYRPINTLSHLRLSQIDSLQEVLDCLERLRREQPGFGFLCTLDDIDQCCYTSMHAADDQRLALDNGSDVDFDDPEAMHAWETDRLRHLAACLQAPQWQVPWQALVGTLDVAEEDIEALLAMNRQPDDVLDRVVYVQRLPLSDGEPLIAGLPNGYFSCDWNVFQNQALIQYLSQVYAYRFFGIGASWLGFTRDAPLPAEQARKLVADLVQLYAMAGQQVAPLWEELTEILQRQQILLLGYTESFAG